MQQRHHPTEGKLFPKPAVKNIIIIGISIKYQEWTILISIIYYIYFIQFNNFILYFLFYFNFILFHSFMHPLLSSVLF